MTRQCSCGHIWASTEAMREECEPAGILTVGGAVIEQGTCRHCGSTRAVTCRRDTEELQRLERYHALAYAGYVEDRVPASVVADAYERAATMRECQLAVEAIVANDDSTGGNHTRSGMVAALPSDSGGCATFEDDYPSLAAALRGAK